MRLRRKGNMVKEGRAADRLQKPVGRCHFTAVPAEMALSAL
jgi:hypothetical protein